MKAIRVIGVDCAAQPVNVGLALAELEPSGARIVEATTGRNADPATVIAGWLEGRQVGLIALDAPLGWPRPIAESLAGHRAGDPIPAAPNDLFRRATDRFVRQEVGKQPLEVAADRIARAAHAALELLARVREITGRPIPLIWGWGHLLEIGVIEVYPAATLSVRGLQCTRYKRRDQLKVRERLLAELGGELEIASGALAAVENADAFDAMLCVVAARDFLSGNAMPPEDAELARQEGWIWVRRPGADRTSGP